MFILLFFLLLLCFLLNSCLFFFIYYECLIILSLFILLILLHLIRAIWIKSKIIHIKLITFMLIISGYLLFILSMIEGFLGHLLCRGQMSYWGITVMINIVAVLPCCGIIIAELIWSAAWVIGFPRRIYDYSMIFFKFQWFNSLGLIGIYVSIIILLFIIYIIYDWRIFRSFTMLRSDVLLRYYCND